MKVLIVTPCLLPVPAVKGGAVLTLMESLIIQNERQEKLELTVLGSFDEAAVEKSKNYPKTKFIFYRNNCFFERLDKMIDKALKEVKNISQRKRYIRKLHCISFIKKVMRDNDYDKVVFQNSGYLLNVLRDEELLKKYSNKLFYHLHNDIPDNIYVKGVQSCELLLISQYLEKKVCKLCGEQMREKIHIVKNGFNCEQFSRSLSLEEKDSMRSSMGIDKNKKILLFAGRIDEQKGIRQLLEAFSSMERNDLVLLVVGSYNFGTKETSRFEGEIRSRFNFLGDKIKFTGYIPYEDMWKYYKIADIAVLPSMWEEPAGLTMIEAAASGTVVITTVSGGIPEYLNSELAVLLERDENIVLNLKDAITKVLDNFDEFQEKAELAAAFVKENFSEEKYYADFVGALTE